MAQPELVSSSKVCLFCGKEDRRTSEHVIADWLIRDRGLRKVKLGRITVGADGKETDHRPPHVLDSIRLKRVCGSCNSGWMASLEAKAQKILRPMFDAEELPTLRKDQRKTLALWATKTAFMLNRSSNFDTLVSDEEIAFLNGGHAIPNTISVFMARNSMFSKIDWVETSHFGTITPETMTMLGANGWKIGLQIGHLCLIASKVPDPRLVITFVEGVHVPIALPRPVPVVQREKEPFKGESAHHELRYFLGTLVAVTPEYDGSEPSGDTSFSY